MKEIILQRLWKESLYSRRNLLSTGGSTIVVSNPGELQSGDGPDFKGAKIIVDDYLTLYGDIEIHINESDWNAHRHHHDSRYNSVILHVVLNAGKNRVHTHDGYRPLTLVAAPYVSFNQIQTQSKPSEWPCSHSVHFISEQAIQAQFEIARKAYFESLTQQIMQRWDPSLPISEAWNKMFLLSLGNGLGISKNREPMERLAGFLYESCKNYSFDNLTQFAKNASGLFDQQDFFLTRSDWDLSGTRPANSPKKKILDLVCALDAVRSGNPSIIRKNPLEYWERCFSKKGRQFELLFHIVFLPCLYILGDVLSDKKLCEYAYKTWEIQRYKPDSSLCNPFIEAGFNQKILPDHLGVVYQLKHICRKKGCASCGILKAINA